MKIKSGFTLRNIMGVNAIISEGEENIEFNKLFTLNSSAASIWQGVVGQEFNIDNMVAILQKEYDVDETTARKDCEETLEQWITAGLVTAGE